MTNIALFINSLGPVDIAFFIVCAAIIAIAVGVYFLIPVFNKKQYQEQRDNLRKREEAFKSNLSAKSQADEQTQEEQVQQAQQEQENK